MSNIMKLKIALLGGSFNPVSFGHLRMISYFVENDFDKILVIPCGFRRDKSHFASNKDRVNMLRLGI